jgi:hypothetical protein
MDNFSIKVEERKFLQNDLKHENRILVIISNKDYKRRHVHLFIILGHTYLLFLNKQKKQKALPFAFLQIKVLIIIFYGYL